MRVTGRRSDDRPPGVDTTPSGTAAAAMRTVPCHTYVPSDCVSQSGFPSIRETSMNGGIDGQTGDLVCPYMK